MSKESEKYERKRSPRSVKKEEECWRGLRIRCNDVTPI